MYSYNSRKFALIATIVVLVGFAVVQSLNFLGTSGHEEYAGEKSTIVWGQNESGPASPIQISLGIIGAPPLGKTAELIAVVTSAMDAADVEVHIGLPEGFVMISGNPDWKGSVLHDQKVELHYTIESVRTGDWMIEGSVRWVFAEGSFYTARARICISVSESSAYVCATTSAQTEATTLLPGNETSPPPPDQLGNYTTLLPFQQNGQLVMFVSPTLVAAGVETTITIVYSFSPTPSGTETPPGAVTHGGPPSFEGPVVVTYGPMLAENGLEWIAKIRPTSVGLIKVAGQDESGALRVYAEITVVEKLPLPADQHLMETVGY